MEWQVRSVSGANEGGEGMMCDDCIHAGRVGGFPDGEGRQRV